MTFTQTVEKGAKGTTTTTFNSSGGGIESIVVQSKKRNDGTTDITELDPTAVIDQQKNAAIQELEASKEATATINWLGSSYSGQDIKVIAHLYGTSFEQATAKNIKLQGWRDYAEAVIALVRNIKNEQLESIGKASTPAEKQKALDFFFSQAGDTDDGRAAAREIIQIIKFGNTSTEIGRNLLLKTLQEHSAAAVFNLADLSNEIESIEKVRAQAKPTLVLGSLQTLSVQTHREKFAVRALGHSYVKGYTRGPRTIAGSMIFTLFDEHPLKKLMFAMGSSEGIWNDPSISTLIPDQLPPIDLTIVFANEYGSLSRMTIYGVEFVNDGATFSVDDLLSENVMQFIARDVDILTKAGQVQLSKLNRNSDEGLITETSASSLSLRNDNYLRYLDTLKVRRRLVNR